MKSIRSLSLTIVLLAVSTAAVAAPRVYVADQALNRVLVYDTSSPTWPVVATIPLPAGSAPSEIAIPSVGGVAWVANQGGSVSRIDLSTNAVTTIPVIGNPTSLAVSPDGTRVVVVQSNNCPPLPTPTPAPGTPTPGGPTPTATPPDPPCTVQILDGAGAAVATVLVGRRPFAAAISPNGAFAYVTNRGDGTLSKIDLATNTVVGLRDVGATPEAVTIGAGEIYVANDASNSVTVFRELDFNSPGSGGTIAVGGSPLSLAVSPDGRSAVIGNDTSPLPNNPGTVSLVTTGTHAITGSVTVGSDPAGAAFLPNSSAAVVANLTGGSVSVIPLTLGGPSLTLSVPGGAPSGVAISPEPSFLLTKTADKEPAIAAQTLTYSLVYANLGTAPANAVTITDPVPANLTFVSATGGGALVGTDVVWGPLTVPVGGTATLQATFTVNSPIANGTIISNVATLDDGITPPVQATVDSTVQSDPVFSLSLVGAPNPVVAGTPLTYTLTYGNLGTDTSNPTFIDLDFDPNVTFDSASPPPTSGSRWDIGALPPGGSGTITITVNVNSPLANGLLLETLGMISDPLGHTATVTAVNAVSSTPGLTLSVADGPDPVPAGGDLIYDFTYGNTGNGHADGVVLTLAYDANVVFVESNPAPDAGTTNQWTLGTVLGGSSGHVVMKVRVASVLPNATILSSLGQIADVLANTASATAVTTVQSEPTLSLIKSDDPNPVASGDTLTYTLTYSNVGGDVANGVVVTETYPAAVTFVSAVPAPDVGTDNVWTIGSVGPGASGAITITTTATAPNGTVATNTAVVQDNAGHSATSTTDTRIDLIPELSVSLVDSPNPLGPDPVSAGAVLTYALTYANTGTLPATAVVVNANYPAGTHFISASITPDAGTSNRWTIGTLANGASATITIRLAVDPDLAQGTILSGGASIVDASAVPVTTDVQTTVNAGSGLVVATSSSVDPVAAGQQVVYDVTVSNRGATAAAGAVINLTPDPNLNVLMATAVPAFELALPGIYRWNVPGTLDPGEALNFRVTMQVKPAAVAGSITATTATLSSPSSGTVYATQLTRVGTSPIRLTLSTASNPVGAGGALDYTLAWQNTSGAPLPGVTVILNPDARTSLVSAIPAPLTAPPPPPYVWNLGTLGVGASGSAQIQMVPFAQPGSILTAVATATSGSTTSTAVTHTGVTAGSELNLLAAHLKRPVRNRPNAHIWQVRADIELPGDVDVTKQLSLTVATATKMLASQVVAPNALVQKSSKKWSWKSAHGALPVVSFAIIKMSGNTKRVVVKVRKADLPLPNGTTITTSLAIGSQSFSSVQTFRMSTTPGPGSLYY